MPLGRVREPFPILTGFEIEWDSFQSLFGKFPDERAGRLNRKRDREVGVFIVLEEKP
jgi:hypothetical protein